MSVIVTTLVFGLQAWNIYECVCWNVWENGVRIERLGGKGGDNKSENFRE